MNAEKNFELAKQILETANIVAVLGASKNPEKPAHYVPAYLLAHGYKIIPVNASLEKEVLFGEVVHQSLSNIAEPVDVVDVFRRAELLPEHLNEILAMQPLPRVVWLQLGIRNDEFVKELEANGIAVVQDRCMLADHRNMGIQRRL